MNIHLAAKRVSPILLRALALCVALFAVTQPTAAPLKVSGRYLQDAHGNNIQMRGVNVPVYKSGYADDIDAVAAAIALTKANAVRLEWWAVPLGGQTEYTVEKLDRAIQKFYDLGIIPIVELHDLTFDWNQARPPGGPDSRSNDRTVFADTITAFWTRADVVAVLKKHQDHLVINLANEWGSSLYHDAANNEDPTTAAAAAANFVLNYTNAIAALRNAGIVSPLMVDAPKGFEYQFVLDHGQELLAADPRANTMLSVHAYLGAGVAAPYFTDAQVNTILDALKNSGLPIVLGEVSSNAWVNNPCDPINYVNLLTRANTNAIGYLFWVWYEDNQCSPDVNPIPPGQPMSITTGTYGDGVTLPTAPGYPYDALYHPAFGIDTAQPPTSKADFTPLAPSLLNTSFGYNVTSTNDTVTRAATAQVTRLDNFAFGERRPVVVLMPGWGGAGDVAAVQDAQAVMFANAGYVALNIGFHQTSDVASGPLAAWYSDLAESAKGALDSLCAQAYADCGNIVLTGESYGGTQTHPVVRYLRALGTYDGSGAGNAGRRVVGFLGQDSGYTLNWNAPVDADATAYSIAMIQNLGDGDFPVDSCGFGNCGARNRAEYHRTAAGSQYVLSYCPAGGVHGSRGYADWDAWVLSAVKVMLHNQRGAAKFAGYAEPAIAVSNACLAAQILPAAPTIGTAIAGDARITVAFTPGNIGSGTLVRHTADCGGITNTGLVSPITVTGLANGTAYTCRVNTTSTVGDSPWSALSNSVTPFQVFGLTVVRGGAGSGTVTSSPAGINCGTTCAANFAAGVSVTLTATASAGSTFAGWSGAGCSGTGTCVVAVADANLVTATFNLVATPGVLSVSPGTLAFGGQSMNTTSPGQIATIANAGGTALTVSSLTLSAGYALAGSTCGTLPAPLAAGASCTATLTFTPATEGSVPGTLTVTSSAGSQPIGLTGTGERSLVTHYYRSILRRAPDAGGKTFWDAEATRVKALGVNVNEVWYSMAQTFYTSAEYLAFGRDNTGFVTDLFNTFFNRAPDAGGLAYWKGQLDSGLPREVLLSSFMFSTEFSNFTQTIFGNTAVRAEINTVTDFYRGLLSRLPDDGGFAFWLAKFKTAQCSGGNAVNAEVESISGLFANGTEYTNRSRSNSQYVGDLYNAFLRRGGDLAGVQFWIDQLASSARSRENVRQAFVASPEFQARVAAIIAQGCLP